MKHRLFLLFAIVIVLTFAGCASSNSGREAQDSPPNNVPSESPAPLSPNRPADGLPSVSLNASWPKDALPAELPEYTNGSVTASGEDGGVIYIKIKDTDKSELDTYLDTLKNAGWIVASDDTEAVLGNHTVMFDLQGGGTYLQIAVYTAEAGTWPEGEIPSEVIPPRTGTLVEKIEILESTQDVWYFDYTYDGIDEAAAAEYMATLRDNGWDGDDYMVTKTFEWNGKNYGASIEIYETLETRTTFTCNFWLEG